ncbi:hypothetical protein F2P56_024688 [Juglans regia]|uniref:CUE domain-containing protein n=2 Tax=Juglans regia TaxID=51240 RepID=A0A833TUV1_JUGRE|nr:uncharacterized protein LOC109010916 isoform X2 [Juglans regia]KAF5455075.1 hypothetical protein F2P56_024688 [Juglans regia]
MDCNSVYPCLQELFPTVDSRLLKAVSIEHSKDANLAVEIVCSEIIPYLSGWSVGSSSPPEDGEGFKKQRYLLSQPQVIDKVDAGPSSEPQSIAYDEAKERDHTCGVLHADATPLVEALNDSTALDFYDANEDNNQSCRYTENEEVILLGNSQEKCVKVGLSEIDTSLNALSHGENDDQKSGNTGSEELTSLGICKENEIEMGSETNLPGMTISSVKEKDGVKGTTVNDLDYDWRDIDFPMANDSNNVVHGESPKAESCSNISEAGSSVLQFVPTSIKEHTLLASGSSDITFKQHYFVSEMSDIKDETKADAVINGSGSGQECKIHLLEEIIEDAKNNKKTLFLAMERVINMMREVELQEKAAAQAKEEACRGGLDILVKVEEMKQMLAHAKEANNMHAGEVYGEKAILATEVRELQSRLLCLSDERDKSLAILDEMHQALQTRLAMAEELRKAAERERLEKEESAQNDLDAEEAIMEKVVQESKVLEQEAEENSRLREFLMDRGRVVDILQGEISVICQDVRLLKEKFDDRVPLSKSVSSSQTSCILATSGASVKGMTSDLLPRCSLASSGSSMKSIASDLVPDRSLASSTSSLKSVPPFLDPEEKLSPTPSVHSLSTESRHEEESARTDHQALLDDGWDFFDKDAELDSQVAYIANTTE